MRHFGQARAGTKSYVPSGPTYPLHKHAEDLRRQTTDDAGINRAVAIKANCHVVHPEFTKSFRTIRRKHELQYVQG